MLLVGAAVLYMVVYGHVFHPGYPQEFYDRHVRAAGPWISIVAGVPIFFFLAERLARRAGSGSGRRSVVALWAIWAIADTAILAAAEGLGGIVRILPLWCLSLLTKLAGIWLGVRFQERRHTTSNRSTL